MIAHVENHDFIYLAFNKENFMNKTQNTDKLDKDLYDLLNNTFADLFKISPKCPEDEIYIPANETGYPLYDQFFNVEGDLVFEFALAGFPKTGLNVSTHVQTRTLSVEGSCKHEEKPVGRRIARRSFVKKFTVDTTRLDLSKVTSTFVDGLLTVKVPLNKTPPTNDQVKVQIF